MIISNESVKEIESELTPQEKYLAKMYAKNNFIRIEDIRFGWNKDIIVINTKVKTKDRKIEVVNIYIDIDTKELNNLYCTCRRYSSYCEHALAAVYELNSRPEYEQKLNKWLEDIKKEEEQRKFISLIEKFKLQSEENKEVINKKKGKEIEKESIDLYPILKDNYDEYELSFKIGSSRMYKIKSMSEFYNAYKNEEIYKYGEALQFKHKEDNFTKNAKAYINFISQYGETIKYAKELIEKRNKYYYNQSALPDNKIILNKDNIEEFIECFKNSNHKIEIEKRKLELEVEEKEPKIKFEIKKIDKDRYKLNKSSNIENILEGNNKSYIIDNEKIVEFNTKKYKDEIKLLKIWEKENIEEFTFDKKGLIDFVNVVLPKINNSINLEELPEEEKEKYIPKNLAVKMKLDLNEKGDIINEVVFCYGDKEFNPLKENLQIPRHIQKEQDISSKIVEDGFNINADRRIYIMKEEEKIYEFLTDKINTYMKEYEILVTDEFKNKEIRHPKIQTLGVRIQNNLLNLDLSGIDYDPKEIQEIMNKYKLKKKYHKLKDGSFISLEKNEDMDFLENLSEGLEINYKEISKGTLKLPVNRSLYLNKMLEKIPNTQIKENIEFKTLIEDTKNAIKDEEIKIPKKLEKILRTYQKTGYKWLTVLDKYRFGGILADDMGLGKTLQLIAILLNAKKEKKPSIVVCPSSLTLNWKNEIEKFAKELKVSVIRGTSAERDELIKNVDKNDLVITSYDLLKRDIDKYKEEKKEFRYIIADEAQYIKNNNTQNAKALKELEGQTRYALTGTPIENSLSELWSIFDFIMPGYLFSYSKFKKDFETKIIKDNDEKAMKRLKTMIEPFILRRIKKEVLTELPDKTISILNNEMEKEQQKIYISYLAKFKKEIMQTIQTEGFEKSQIKILSLLTRLRQICCHPGLFIDEYEGESSKLNQCIEIIEDAISGEHKMLLFSNYTQMFPIIETELQKRNIKYYKLTGQTKIDERIKMVDEFNEDKNVKIFLISLKAGGTGLNLTGADMVIHYDPWWNLSAENQATDRVYRIGQKNNVQVYKLITKNSIEEKIQELQEKKAVLVDNVLDTKQTFINKLSKNDIMSLFDT